MGPFFAFYKLLDERRECLPGISVQAGELTALLAVQQESGCSGLWKCTLH